MMSKDHELCSTLIKLGTPITTSKGINIGSLCILDTKVREGLSEGEQQSLGWIASQVMSYLEINREAIEGRRAQRQSDGLNHFVEGKSCLEDPGMFSTVQIGKNPKRQSLNTISRKSQRGTSSSDSDSDDHEACRKRTGSKANNEENVDSYTHAEVFSRAANLIREALELEDASGVLFVGAKTGLTPRSGRGIGLRSDSDAQSDSEDGRERPLFALSSQTSQISTSTTFDPILNDFIEPPKNPAPILAFSTADVPFGRGDLSRSAKNTSIGQIDEEMLRKLLVRYPNGKLFDLDDGGGLNSASEDEDRYTDDHIGRKAANNRGSVSWTQRESSLLILLFPGVRQLMFSPLWDASRQKWSSGCFVWTSCKSRVFAATTELGFLNSFGKTIMAECSRLDALLESQQKGDFIGWLQTPFLQII